MIRLALLGIAPLLLLLACGAEVTTQVIPIEAPLPAAEEAVYRLLDAEGRPLGRAVLSIAAEGDRLRLGQRYDFGEGQLDESAVLVERATMRPVSSERLVQDGEQRWATAATYTADTVTVGFEGERGERERRADISETTYDNLESLFLWRATALGAGNTLRYINVVVDPKRGTISRALARLTVIGRENVRLADNRVLEAWRVEFNSAGVTNIAWYAVTGDRRLLRYEIARGPTLLLESAVP